LARVARYDLGTLQGTPLTFTGAAAMAFGLLCSAAAANSPDAVTTSPLAGSAIGVLDNPTGGRWIERTTPVVPRICARSNCVDFVKSQRLRET
jgi:hypothetical protein